jgi:hypothetical protein
MGGLKRNNAKYYYDIGNESQVKNNTKTIELNPVVKAALQDLTNTINSFSQRNPYSSIFMD